MERVTGLVSFILHDLALAKLTYNKFHNLTFPLTRDVFDVLLIQHSLQNFLFPKGVVDGERPLRFALPKFGTLSRNSRLVSLSDPSAYFKGPLKKQIPLRV